ncbi:MAG: PHP domain-containing protein [Spirochaetes bacterium]|nr:PHP domain-containing protein [Spirochaetota bacterium]
MRCIADLHIHSCLSPCGDLSMSPSRIAKEAARIGLSLIALTDHNSALNCPAFAEACRKEGIVALFGIEVTTIEEIHVLALFPTVEQALELGTQIARSLPKVPYDPERHGDQVYVNESEEILGEVDTYLGVGTHFSLDGLLSVVQSMGGLFIPSHIDRPVNSLLSQLGRIPELPYSALEVTRWPPPVDMKSQVFVTNSDAHIPELIGTRYTIFEGDSPSFESLRNALQEGMVIPSLSAIDAG